MGAARTREINPRIANRRAMLGPLVRDGRHEEAAQVRQELHEAKLLVAAQKVAAQVWDLPPDSPVRDEVRAIFACGAT